jgi:hypothetical protein
MNKIESTNSASVVIYGPAGCGKSRNAAALARHYGKSEIVDDWQPHAGRPVPANALVLTNASPAPRGAIEFASAMRAAGLATRL